MGECKPKHLRFVSVPLGKVGTLLISSQVLSGQDGWLRQPQGWLPCSPPAAQQHGAAPAQQVSDLSPVLKGRDGGCFGFAYLRQGLQ